MESCIRPQESQAPGGNSRNMFCSSCKEGRHISCIGSECRYTTPTLSWISICDSIHTFYFSILGSAPIHVYYHHQHLLGWIQKHHIHPDTAFHLKCDRKRDVDRIWKLDRNWVSLIGCRFLGTDNIWTVPNWIFYLQEGKPGKRQLHVCTLLAMYVRFIL